MPRKYSIEFKEKAAYQMRAPVSLCAGVGLQATPRISRDKRRPFG